MIRDIALVEEVDGYITVHQARCPAARDAAAAGRPVLTLLQIQRPISLAFPLEKYRRHECMEERHERRR